MNDIRVNIVNRSEELPDMTCNNFFHSKELFGIIERTSGQSPYMVIATDCNNNVIGHLLAIVRRRGSLFPPYLFTQGRIYGEGEYAEGCNSEAVFGLMLSEITKKFKRKFCLFAEFSDISHKMFGYRYFRSNGYFCVHWQEVHNSLHSKPPYERLTAKARRRIEHAEQEGVSVRLAVNDDDVRCFYRILKHSNRLSLRRLVPTYEQFLEMLVSKNANVFVTVYEDKIIGGCACAYSQGNAYLWYLATRNKRYIHLHPDQITVWRAITHAYEHGCQHFCFLDAGLPMRGNPFRDFILSFGGKPVAKYRWFRFSFPWLNRLFYWMFRD